MELSSPQGAIAASTNPVNLFLAGQGSGKSHLAGLIGYNFVSRFPICRGLIAANTHQQLTRSTLAAVRKVWKSLGVEEYSETTKKGHYVISKQPPKSFDKLYDYDNYNGIISFCNGAVIYLASLENYKAIDGIEIAWAILDETKDTREEAVKEVILGRLRQMGIYIDANGNQTSEPTDKPFNPVYFLTSPAKVAWLNEMFSLDDYADEIREKIYYPPDYFKKVIGNKFVTISSTYLNKHNLPSNYIDNQKQNLPSALQNMLIFGDPFSKAGGEAFYGFDRALHVVKGLREKEYKQDLPLHISFDFNTKPFTSLLVFQIKDKKVFLIDEICSENNTIKACKAFMSKYGSHRGGLFSYGDPNGRAASTKTEEGTNDYTIIQRELKTLKPSMRVASKAPAVAMRINWINAILEGNSSISLLIDERCKNSINDFLYLKHAADGTKAKTKKTVDGITFEEYGHTSDATEYMLCKAFETDWNQFSKGTTGGNIRVVSSGRESKRY